MDTANTIIVFDTNVLLTDAEALLSYPGADIIVPETVLNEIDKLKTARVDPDLKYHGREVSRLIFDLAEGQSFVDGVDLPNGGRMRVVPFEINPAILPEGFSTKTSDNKILATAYQVKVEEAKNNGKKLILITNDLNMLLKAQTLGIEVEQFGNGDDLTWSKKYIVRPFQRYRVPLTILMISIAIFAAVLVIAIRSDFGANNSATTNTEMRSLLTESQKNAYDARLTLKDNSADQNALLVLANFYNDRATQNQVDGDNASMLSDAKTGISYYEKYLAYAPTDADARSDMATLYYYRGDTDRAIQEISKVLESNPNHTNANYNLGMFYYFGRRDLDAAQNQMKKVMELTSSSSDSTDSTAHALYQQAKAMLDRIKQDQANGTSSAGTTTNLESSEKSSTDNSGN